MSDRILIAGIGNIFHGDDAFGVELAQRLCARTWPESVLVKDFGIRSFDLAYALLDEWRAVIMLDIVARGGAPGTLYMLEIDPHATSESPAAPDAHSMDPVQVLNLAAQLGTVHAKLYVLGCELEDLGDEFEGRMGLTATLAAALPQAEEMVVALVDRIQHEPELTQTSATFTR